MPEHDPALVERTLAALEAGPETQIGLNKAWRSVRKLVQHYGKVPEKIPLAEFLRHARIRPVDRQVIAALHRLTISPLLKRIMDQHREDQWELWDLLEAMAGMFDVKRLWQAEPWQPENLSNLLPAEAFRRYSIASTYRPGQVDLTVGGLHYTTEETKGCPVARHGTASGYVNRMPAGSGPVAVQVLRKKNFALPGALEVPIIMFAAGTGLAPFRGFLQQRLDRSVAMENWLLYSVRRPEDICHREEIEAWLSTGRLRLDVQITGADLRAIASPAGLNFEPGPRGRVDDGGNQHGAEDED
jgi:sulfite reductase (NADPH) flavoprotein alpha-component